MKKFLVVFIMLFVCGCGKSNETLKCVYNNLEFEEGTMDVIVNYGLDNQEYVVSSTKEEYRHYNNKEDATKFYESNENYSTKNSDTEIVYLEIRTYKDKVLAKDVKNGMEGQQYICEYIKSKEN